MWKLLTPSSPEIEPYAIFGVGVGEGLAAVCGHQSGGQGMRVVKPVSSLGARNGVGVMLRFPAPSPFYFRPR